MPKNEESGFTPYNPLDKINLGISVADAMLESEVYPLGKLPAFTGAGIYAIYYAGDFEAYMVLAERNKNNKFELPIYVGKAVSPGARKGAFGLNSQPGQALYKRLQEHADSINAVENLNIHDFFCRFLIVDDIWIPLGESLLIAKFHPLWNQLIEGFGNHEPGKGRHGGTRPKWDTLHPGRKWADNCQQRSEDKEVLKKEAMLFLRAQVNLNS